jgi:SAM-dependent methyltransferase
MMVGPGERARSFGAQAELYDRLRPGYPAAALDAVLPRGARRVADVGAGTGKLTAALSARGLAAVAVEPDAAMRAVLARRLPAVDVRSGDAEALPLADGEVDAVLFATAWHWVEPEQAAREARRVLASGGVLAMLWNLFDDDRHAWVADLNRLTARDAGITDFPDPPALAGFAAGERVDVPWQQILAKDELVDLVRTWSAVSTRRPAERDEVLAGVRRLLGTHPDVAAQDRIALPYVCSTRTYRSVS